MNTQRDIKTNSEMRMRNLGEIGLNNFEPYLMNRIMARYNANLSDALSAHDLTTPKMRVLACLAVVHKPLIRELVVYTVINQSTLSRTLDSLEVEGLIARELDANDGRATRISMTGKGREAFEAIWPFMDASHRELFEGISAEERNAFVGTLQKILRNIRKNPI